MNNIFQISPPKSGSYLLSMMLGAERLECLVIPEWGKPTYKTETELIDGIAEGCWWGHLPHSEAVELVLSKHLKILLLRDPRDIVVSHAHYVEKAVDVDYFVNESTRLSQLDLNERLSWLVENLDLSIYTPWIDKVGLVLRYEHLLETKTLVQISNRTGRGMGAIRGATTSEGFTFRHGVSGEWREALTDAQKELALAHLPVKEWGYEEG